MELGKIACDFNGGERPVKIWKAQYRNGYVFFAQLKVRRGVFVAQGFLKRPNSTYSLAFEEEFRLKEDAESGIGILLDQVEFASVTETEFPTGTSADTYTNILKETLS